MAPGLLVLLGVAFAGAAGAAVWAHRDGCAYLASDVARERLAQRRDVLPAFAAANRSNAYNTYLLLEKESLQR